MKLYIKSVLILSVLILAISYHSVAQSSYYHYEFSSKDQTFYIDLIINDSSGYLALDASFMKQPTWLKGTIDPKTGDWQFTSNDKEEIKLFFQLKNKTLEGLRMESRVGGSHALPTPALVWNKGNVPFKMLNFKLNQKLFPEFIDSPAASFNFLFPDPQWVVNLKINDSIRRALLKIYIAEDSNPKQISSVIQNYLNVLGRQYQEENRDSYDPNGFNDLLNNEFTVTPWIACNTGFILSIAINKYAYTGGAHGLEATQFINLNLKNGKNYRINDLFDTSNSFIAGKLRQLISLKLKEQYGLDENQPLTDASFFTNEVDLPVEFYITPTGIVFYYNEYEIAPYSMGSIKVFLKWNEVKNLMGEAIWSFPVEFLSNAR